MMEEHIGRILVVEDDRASMMHLVNILENNRHTVLQAFNGDDAMRILENETLDAVLLDNILPGITGLELLGHIRKIPKLSKIPVVMVTSSDRPEQIQEALRNNVLYYMVKPVNENIVKAVVSSAVRESKQKRRLLNELDRYANTFSFITQINLEIKTIDEAESAASFIANCFPKPQRSIQGIAQLLINGIEHGNCKIGYDMKTTLIANGRWRDEVNYRCSLPENEDKKVLAKFWRDDTGFYIEVKDSGNGFDWQSYTFIDPSRSNDNHGRGLAEANTLCFDSMQFFDNGSRIIACVKNGEEINW